MTAPKYDLPLGASVTITGVVVGRSEFADKNPTYWVEYERQGKPVRDWFVAAELAENGSPSFEVDSYQNASPLKSRSKVDRSTP